MDQIYKEEMDWGDYSGILVSGEMRVTHVSEAYNTCPKCGSIDVPYPLSTDDNCGDPRYKVYCNNGILEFLSARGFYY
ncbi:wall-associated receptor kinase-like 15 [Quercus suber]|uniref:Wall-associated receptor kinase-like 15 n=1 Tax=Quercus suber TaxID=58331 RepID=A0AAW0JM74_QUESU